MDADQLVCNTKWKGEVSPAPKGGCERVAAKLTVVYVISKELPNGLLKGQDGTVGGDHVTLRGDLDAAQ